MNAGPAERRLVLFIAEYRYFLSHRLELARAALRQGYRVWVLTRVPDGTAPPQQTGLEIVHVPTVRSLRPLADLRLMRQVLRELRRIRPHILHNVSIKLVLLGSLCGVRAGVPRILNAFTGLGYSFRAGGLGPRLMRLMLRPVLGWIARRPGCWSLFQNGDDRERFQRMGLLVESRTALIAGTGVDVEAFAPVPPPGGAPVVLFVGRLLLDKGIAEFVAAAEQLKVRGVAARFVAVGDRDDQNPRSVSTATLAAWRSGGAVDWWGFRSDMPAVYRQAHLVCLPSHHEGLPKVLLEGGAAGLPLVASDIAACRLVVEEGVNGFLVPAGNSDQLAQALEKIILNKELRVNMGRESRRIITQRFSADRINGQLIDLYKRIESQIPPGRAEING